MNQALIRAYLWEFSRILGEEPQTPLHPGELVLLHIQKDYLGMFELIKNHLNLPIELSITFVDANSIDGKAMRVTIPQEILYGENADGIIVKIKVAQEFLPCPSCGLIAFAMAHELCHIILAIKKSPLCSYKAERVVDLAAMFLGYRESIFEFVNYWTINKNGDPIYSRNGYLTPEERLYSLQLMQK